MVKKFIIALLLIVVGGFALIEAYLFSYRSIDGDKADQVYSEAKSKVKARDALAQDAARNGYSDLEYSMGKVPEAITAPYGALSEWTYASTGDKKKDILFAWKTNAAQIQAAAADFEKVLPKIDAALAKPNFIWQSDIDDGVNVQFPNFIHMRRIAQNLVGYAEYCEVKGEPSKALGYDLSAVELGARIMQNGMLVTAMIGIAIQAIGLDATTEFINRAPKLSAEDYRGAIRRLDALTVSAKTFLDRMDEEYAWQLTIVDQVVNDPKAILNAQEASAAVMLLKFPGYMARERRVIQNLYMQQRPSFEGLQYGGLSTEELAKHLPSLSVVAATLIPNYSRAVAQMRLVLTKIGGVKLLCALQAYHLEKGEYPDSLDALVPAELKEVPKSWVSQDGKFTYHKEGKTFKLSVEYGPLDAEFLKSGRFSFFPCDPRK